MGKVNPGNWNDVWMNYGVDAMRSVRLLFKRTQFLERVPRDARILDIGCGRGSLLRALDHAGYTRLQGLEPESQLFKGDDLMGRIRAGDCLKLGRSKAQQGRYDVAVMVGVLHHLKDFAEVQQCLKNIHTVLKDGGRFYSMEPWKNIVRSIMMKLVRDTPLGYLIFRHDRVLLKLEERELGQWLEFEREVTAYAPQAGLKVYFQAKDIRYRYIIFEKVPMPKAKKG